MLQGTVLGPLLFNLYINDLFKNIPSNCKIVQYADDTLLFTENKDLKHCFQNLEKSCKLAHQNFNIHSLNLNDEKIELIVIPKKIKNNTGGSIKVDGRIIESKKSVKCLGIMIDSLLNFLETSWENS